MKILVLMSSYNGEKYIQEQIESILNQKINGTIGLIVRDDGSKDGTVEILKKYEQQNKLVLLLGNNIGYVKSFFWLLNYAREHFNDFDFFAFSDQDDVWDLDKLEIAVTMIKKANLGDIPILYGSTSRLTDANLKIIGQTMSCYKPVTFYNVAVQNSMSGHTQVFNKAMLNIIPTNLNYDKVYVHDYFITVAASLCGKIIFDQVPHVFYRQHSDNQIGVEANFFRRLVKRWYSFIRNRKGIKIVNQMQYLVEIYSNQCSQEELIETQHFINCRCNFSQRLKYIFCMKFYRQTDIQTILMKIIYLIGGFGV